MSVYLVGAGPGDPELISVRGARLLAAADVVIYDRLARPLLGFAAPNAELVDVGKAPGSAPVPQAEINHLLVQHGRRHRCVVRLKGGDPLVFARGAEEVEALQAAGIEFAIVPGISSVLAAPAVAGVPLTSRGVTRSFTVLSGHDDPELLVPGYLEALIALGGTIVVLMGAARAAQLAACLLGAGLSSSTPVVAVRAATTDDEEVCRSTLGQLGEVRLAPPTVLLVGEVAGFDLRAAGAMA